jgi:hypothetical protein
LATSERIREISSDSRVVGFLWSLITAPAAARRDAKARYLAKPVLSLTVQERVRTAGLVVVIAVLSHALVFALSGISVRRSDWGLRAGLVAAGLTAVWRPEALLSAWREWKLRRIRH